MTNKDPFEVLQAEAPSLSAAFNGFLGAFADGELDDKTRQLIYIGIRASQGESGAVAAHVPMAKRAGATRGEIRDTILMTLAVCGVTGLTHCLIPALDAYENC